MRRRRDLRTGILLGLLCLVVYNANLRGIGTGDSLPARYLPFGLWHYGSLLLDPIAEAVKEGHSAPYWIVEGRAGHQLSIYPVVLPVLVAPLYLPAVGYLDLRGWAPARLRRVAAVMEKAVASLLAAMASVLMYRLLRRRAAPADALLLALAFAFGTETWMIGSQALWQHGLAELLLAGVLLLITGPSTPARALAAGVLCGLVAANRPPDALLAAALGLCGLLWAGWLGRRAVWLTLGMAAPLVLVLAYNLAAAGNLAGGYALPRTVGFFRNGFFAGAAGMLFSPARGLFVFSPFLLLVPVGFRRGLEDRGARALTLAIGGASLAQLFLYARADWRAGYSWGPRWLTDLLPLLIWLLPPALAALRGAGRALFVLAVAASIAVQGVGAFWYQGASDLAIYAVPPGPGEMRAAWDPRNTSFLVELRHRPAALDPAFRGWRERSRALGGIDRLTAAGRAVETVAAGVPLGVEGWTLVDGHSPSALEVTLDGWPQAVTTAFFDRPDVRASVPEHEPAGWRVALATGGIGAGPHLLAATARAADGAALPVAEREVTVLAGGTAPAGDPRLAAAARVASALVKDRQRPAGFWLTSYTGAPRFELPHREMNTYLTAMMVDLLTPVAAEASLGGSVARARAHLGVQIEASGLVRYHGLPDAPTIPSLGCAITPDADDTALAWRLAGGQARVEARSSLPAALAVLARYRTPEGLYRTWLAPRESYRCIDPGKDPNPPDIGIQMHLLLFFAQADPPAAQALCGALRRAAGEERLWVYYREAPLVPLLRLADLGQAGCPLALPEARLRTAVDGQESWLAAARLLDRWRSGEGSAELSAETASLLGSLAEDDFARLRRSPPLLYHNDVSARTSRFYWSEDFGYALWLRLYFESLHPRGAGRAEPR